jgi:hypothetical protein
MEEIGFFTPSPGQMKSGKMNLAGSSLVSRTRRRIGSLDRKRRGLCIGKGI